MYYSSVAKLNRSGLWSSNDAWPRAHAFCRTTCCQGVGLRPQRFDRAGWLTLLSSLVSQVTVGPPRALGSVALVSLGIPNDEKSLPVGSLRDPLSL